MFYLFIEHEKKTKQKTFEQNQKNIMQMNFF